MMNQHEKEFIFNIKQDPEQIIYATTDDPLEVELNAEIKEECLDEIKFEPEHIPVVEYESDNTTDSNNDQKSFIESSKKSTKHYYCQICDRNFDKKGSYTRHHRLAHEKTAAINSLTCCNKSFLTEKQLSKHQRNIHFEETSETKSDNDSDAATNSIENMCDICDRSFCNRSSYRRHVREIHKKEPDQFMNWINPFIDRYGQQLAMSMLKCDICDKDFGSKSSYRRHMRQVHKQNVITHSCCNVKFETLKELQRHKDSAKCNRYNVKCEEPVIPKPLGNAVVPAKASYCELCDRNFSVRSSFIRHMRQVHKQEPSLLTCCNLPFTTYEQYEKHRLVHERNIRCKICDRAFSQNRALNRHMRSVHEQQRLFSCAHCGKAFALKSLVLNHLETRVCIKPKMDRTHCLYCNFQSLKHVSTHMKTCRGNLRRCASCDLVIFDIVQFNQHLTLHPENKLFECKQCLQEFLHPWEFVLHNRSHDVKEFICEVCARAFKTDSQRRRHMIFHGVEKNFACDTCGKKFSTKPQLKKHIFVKHSGLKPFMCDACGSTFPRMNDLTRHIQSVHNTERDFKCDVCDKTFKLLHVLRTHQLIHLDNKPFKCNLCDKSYTQSYSLKEHLVLHTNPLKCKVCDQSFTRLRRLNEHIRLNNCISTSTVTVTESKPMVPLQWPPITQSVAIPKTKPDATMQFQANFHQDSYSVRGFSDIGDDFLQSTIVEFPVINSMTQYDDNKNVPLNNVNEYVDTVMKEEIKTEDSVVFVVVKEEEITVKSISPPPTADLHHCIKCKKTFNTFQSYRSHMLRKHKIEALETQWTCCNLTFSTEKLFTKHKSNHERNIKCKICSRAFSRKNALKRHIISAHEPPKPFICEHCHKSFTGRNHIWKHLVRRACLKPPPIRKILPVCEYLCDFCNKQFTKKNSLKKHLTRCRQNVRRCITCDIMITTMEQFKQHLEKHPENTLIKCEHCERSFLQVWEHTMHLSSHENKLFVCDVCQKMCKTNSQLIEHQLIHSGEKNFACQVCGKKFLRKHDLRKHWVVTHSGLKPFMCETCSSAFPRMTDLKRHIECVHNEDRPFKCDICEKAFKRKSILRCHINVHGESKPFKCDMCDKSYSQAYSLKEHKILHTNPFKCKVCNRSFTRMIRLREHCNLNNCTPVVAVVEASGTLNEVNPVPYDSSNGLNLLELHEDVPSISA